MGSDRDLGIDAFARRAWGEAAEHLSRAIDLAAADLERLAIARYLCGREHDSDDAWERAHHAHQQAGDLGRAADCAFWLGFGLFLRGEPARAGGWLARASRLVEERSLECAAEGLLLVPRAMEAAGGGDVERAGELAEAALAVGERLGDPDVIAFARLTLGEALIARGAVADGLRLLDEVMVTVTTDDVSPIVAGVTYCAVIESCVRSFDLRRAGEWTDALHRWSETQPDLVPFRGQCLVHRSQILQAHGQWNRASSEAAQACARLAEPPHPALGEAHYQQAELARLRGDRADAEAGYRAAAHHGRDPLPGLALLRLAQGNTEAASAALRRALDATSVPVERVGLLAASVEVALATSDLDGARQASEELSRTAEQTGVEVIAAAAAHTKGAVLLQEGDVPGALSELKTASELWRDLALPYQAARTRVLIAEADRVLGDNDAADLELEAAVHVFEELGAAPDLERARVTPDRSGPSGPLTPRELEVLRLVATGRTNRDVADELVISEHTVARHLQNIFTKLDLSSRAAATAWAVRQGLV